MRTLQFSDMMAVPRLSSPCVSPDGRRVAYVTSHHDPVANKVSQTIRLLDLDTGDSRELTPGPGDHGGPAFSPDGRWLVFSSNRREGSQLWLLPLDGGEARRITSGPGGASAAVWAPDSRRVAFVRKVVVSTEVEGEVDPDKGPSHAQAHGLVNPKSSARVEDELLFRHWDQWRDHKRAHVFVVDTDSGDIADVTPGDWDSPPISLGSARDHDFAPDGRRLCFVANPDRQVARSTNNSVFIVELDGISPASEPRNISTSEACDAHPRFSPDGRSLVYLAMTRPTHEADPIRVKVHDLDSGRTRVLLEDFERSPHSFELDPDGSMVFLAQDRGRQSVYRLDLESGELRQLTAGTWNGNLCLIPGTGDLLVSRQDSAHPHELYRLHPSQGIEPFIALGPQAPADDAGCEATRLTRLAQVLDGITLHPAEEFWYEGAGKTPIHGFLVRPPQFVEGRRYPLVLLIHGGPQGAFSDDFHYRWNAQMFAAQGAVVAFVNPRGSTGYGHALTEQISGDWGGACYEDIMRGLDHIVDTYDFVDGARVGAAGASFGGFMINWILGHTDRFKALVSHDGIFFAETMGYTTEELWFPMVEFGGLPHERRELYERWSPHRHVSEFKTPTLVIQGEQDFRCPASEGLGLFTALQVQGVPSRLLMFPDEGHWVMQPANSEVWYHEVVGWLMRYL